MSELSSGMGGGLQRTARNGCATKTGAEFRMVGLAPGGGESQNPQPFKPKAAAPSA